MQLTYRGRMVAYNLAIFLAIFSFILFCVVQGSIYINVLYAKDELCSTTQDTQLYISEILRTSALKDTPSTLSRKAPSICEHIANVKNLPTTLFDAQGNLLATSANDTEPLPSIFSDEIGTAQVTNQPVLTLTEHNKQTAIFFLAPLDFENQRIGYIGYLFPMPIMGQHVNMFFMLFMIGLLLGFPILIVLTLSYTKLFTQPIKELTQISKEITNGNYNIAIHYRREDEIGALTKVFNDMAKNTNNVISQLDSERNRLAGVLASLDDGLLALDTNGDVITSNSYIKTYFNVSNPKSIYEFQFQSFFRDIFDDLKKGKTHISIEVESNSRNLLIIASPIQKAEFEENYMIIIRNVTSTKQFQKEQQKFISSVSHELRTPLTTIIGYTDMLARRRITDGEMLERSITTINREGHRLLRLVDDLLTVNQFEKPEFDVKKTTLDLQVLIQDVVEQMQIKSHQNNIDINYKSDDILPTILGDYDRLQQMFINILHNAIKYSNNGDIIDVVSTHDDNEITISIRDYGVGISAAEQEKIFSAFYRVEEDRARSEGEGGAGLGLYLVKQIVSKHNGTINIESVVGEGTNIIISLPIIKQPEKEGSNNA